MQVEESFSYYEGVYGRENVGSLKLRVDLKLGEDSNEILEEILNQK